MAKYESHRKVELLAGRRRLIGPGNSWRERERALIRQIGMREATHDEDQVM